MGEYLIVWLPACPELLACRYCLFIVCLAGCLLIGGCLSEKCLFILCLLSVWLAAFSSEAACLEIAHSLSVFSQLCTFCLSSWLPAQQRLLVWKVLIYCLFVVCLAGYVLVGGFVSGHCLFMSVHCLSRWLPAG